nr:uncharacterized protein LOC117683086 [Crassostrea gigas]
MYRFWEYIRQKDEVEKLEKRIALLETSNKELEGELIELRLNRVPLPAPFRDIEDNLFSQIKKTQLLKEINALAPLQQCQHINILLIGTMASGKSSLVNTFKTVLRDNGQIATIAAVQSESSPLVTHMLHEVILQNNPGTKTIRVYDCPGFVSNTPRDCVFEENMKKVIDGNVMKDYQVGLDLPA